jgi:hypothetical protein
MRKWIVVLTMLVIGLPTYAQQLNNKAAKLYFVAVSDWLQDEKAIHSFLRTAEVADAEHTGAIQALVKFKARYAALMEAYNNSPSTIGGTNADTELFLAQEAMLVQNTIELLQASISEKSFMKLSNHITEESLNIRETKVDPVAEHRHGTRFLPVQAGGMTPHYSSYRTSSISGPDSNGGYTYYETAVVNGYTTCSYCPYTHQGNVTNTLGGGGTVYGPRVSPPSQISVSNGRQTYISASCFDVNPIVQCDESWSEQENILCSGTGNIYGSGSIQFEMEPAITFSIVNVPGPPKYYISDWCMPQYAPPDYDPSYTYSDTPGYTYFWGAALCTSSNLWHGRWLCSAIVGAALAYGVTGSWDFQYCTHNTPPY